MMIVTIALVTSSR